jgi:hypothetical protein
MTVRLGIIALLASVPRHLALAAAHEDQSHQQSHEEKSQIAELEQPGDARRGVGLRSDDGAVFPGAMTQR